MAGMRDLGTIFRKVVNLVGQRVTEGEPNPKAQTTGRALDQYAPTAQRHLAAARNQRRHPTAESLRASAADLRPPGSAGAPQQPEPPRSLADEAAAFRAGLRGAAEQFRDKELLGNPGPPPDLTKKPAQEAGRAPTAAQPTNSAGLTRATPGVPGRAPDAKLSKAATAGFRPVSAISESRGQAGAEVNHAGSPVGRGVGLGKEGTGIELKQTMEKK